MANDLDTPGLNRAGRRAAEKRAKRMRAAGAALAAGAATFGTTAAVIGIGATSAGAAELTVTNLDPSGAGSLHDVAEAAGNGDVIVFQAGLTGSIFLDDDIDIDTSITIQGPGAGVVTVSGDTGNNGSANVQIFNIDGGGTPVDVVISGLTLTMGTATEGGAVQVNNANSVTIRDSVLTANSSTSGGGAIEARDSDSPLTLTIENSDVSGNTTDAWGGALYFRYGGAVTITNSRFNGNTAGDGGGAAWIGGVPGGVTITGTEISENASENNVGGGFGIWDADTLNISFSSISGNTSASVAGGLYLLENGPTTIASSNISGNTADGGGGGAFVYDVDGSFTVSNSNISGNTADGGGGGLYLYGIDGNLTITNSTISGNTAQAGGGAWIYGVFGDNNNVIGSLIFGNHATDDSGDGGGLYMGNFSGRTTIAFSTISGNTAATGGGINWYSGEVLRILNTTISGNTAEDDGGGLYVASSTEDVVEIFNSTISGNTTGGEGGAIHFASYYGLEIAQSTITGNTGTTVGGLFMECFEDAGAASASGNDGHAASAEANDGPSDPSADGKRAKSKQVHAKAYGDLSASGSIISGNSGADIGNCGTVQSDHSLIGSIVGATLTDLGGTILGKLPLVAPLAFNGGPTQTHALLPDSPAINTGPNPVATFEGNNNDQRGEGFPRVVGGVVDIGAYEVQPPAVNFTG